jgi:DNA invertase Pin-like site-specific DNA recombinase
MRCALYSRVSTDRQECENQLLQLRAFATSQGWEIVFEFVDTGISGGTADRPAFKEMFSAASKRKFDVLLFWSLDRLSREGALETLQHLNRLAGYGVGYRSFTEQYLDSCGIFKDAVLSILAVVAKQERIRRSERTTASIERRRAAGKRVGPETRIDHARVRALRADGKSFPAIAREMEISVGAAHKACAKGAA